MAIDIFNPNISAIAEGLEGKIILIYGSNNLGKTAQAVRFPKPYVMACEMGLNGISGVPYSVITRWSDFKQVVKQFTSNPKAKEVYSTIIIDEVYASSLYCQDYVCNTFGDGALTLADGDGKHNLYQLYEKEYFKQINALSNSGFTVVFIAHEQENTQTHFITPKGDKRCMNPIIDKCDYVVYLKGNGVDADGKVIKSSAYLAATNQFFARARIEYTPTFIREFTAENLENAIQEGINMKAKLEDANIVSFQEQNKKNTVEELDFDALMKEFQELVASIPGNADVNQSTPEGKKFVQVWHPAISNIVSKHLGANAKISNATKYQVEAINLIVSELKDLIEKG